MSLRYRLRRVEEAIAAKNGRRQELEILEWHPEYIESTEDVFQKTINTHHRQRRYKITVPGDPPQRVYDHLAEKYLPDAETLKGLTDEEIQACQEKYFAAKTAALNASRQVLGLPPVFVTEATSQQTQNEHSVDGATNGPNHRQGKGRNNDGP